MLPEGAEGGMLCTPGFGNLDCAARPLAARRPFRVSHRPWRQEERQSFNEETTARTVDCLEHWPVIAESNTGFFPGKDRRQRRTRHGDRSAVPVLHPDPAEATAAFSEHLVEHRG